MTQTPNFQLNHWSGTDYVRRTDFNADNLKIDTALAQKGNCVIEFGSYQGNGTMGADHPNTLTFDFKPMILMVDTETNYSSGNHILWARPRSKASLFATNLAYNLITWQDNGVSWYIAGNSSATVDKQMNTAGTTYYYIAIGQKDE